MQATIHKIDKLQGFTIYHRIIFNIMYKPIMEYNLKKFNCNTLLYALKLTQYCKSTLLPLKTTQNKGIDK